MRHPDAAVRRRMAQIHALVQGDARPGDALHEGHRRIAVNIRVMEAILLDDAEHAHRSRMLGHAGRNGRIRHLHAVAIEMEALLIDGDENLQRTARDISERIFADVVGFLDLPGGLDLGVVPARVPELRRIAVRVVIVLGHRRRCRAGSQRAHKAQRPDSAEQCVFGPGMDRQRGFFPRTVSSQFCPPAEGIL